MNGAWRAWSRNSLLIDEGYAGFSTRQVAERLGPRLSNVQYYYSTRKVLLEALLTAR